ncbi:monovalent cation/H(+) antiporter subunit G [Ancylobacter sp. VNQ12]|uniref:monovalent cation/H(+) antiporter subunit G n=1 Tax=Ancylobacter sp. VNQ12 TaxID=3400920 RepID=UPI003C102FAD
MRMLLDAFTLLTVTAGLFFFLAGSVALLRFPDALSRLHGLTKADNPGLGLIVLGLLAQADSVAGALKLILVWLLVQFASASAGRLLARAALRDAARGGRSS